MQFLIVRSGLTCAALAVASTMGCTASDPTPPAPDAAENAPASDSSSNGGAGGSAGSGTGGASGATAGAGGTRDATGGAGLGVGGGGSAAGTSAGAGASNSGADASGGAGGGAVIPDSGSVGAGGTVQTNSDAEAGRGGGADAGAGQPDGGSSVSGTVAGTVSIFDGMTLSGWQQSAKNWWSVKDGAIDGKSTSGGEILMSVEDYGDFRIIATSRMPINISGGHLGICFWGGRVPVGGYNKCKLYIPPNPWNWDYNTNGGLNKATFAAGAQVIDATVWHRTEILCRIARGHCQAAVDGKLVMTYDEINLATITKGPIGLQIHAGNSEVQYKDIYIDPAPQDDKLLTLTP